MMIAPDAALGVALLVGGLALWPFDRSPALTLGLESVLAAAAALVFGQGLVRDVATIVRRRAGRGREAAGVSAPPRGPAVNLCLESTLGLVLLALASLYAAFPSPPPVTLPRGLAVAGTGVLLVAGWLVRDWVLTLRHVADHHDLPVLDRRGRAD